MARDAWLYGADVESVEVAITTGSPWTGHAGFAGLLPDERIVRDVLGRYPVFVDDHDPCQWSFDPRDVDSAVSIPAGYVTTSGRERAVWTLPAPSPYKSSRKAVRAVDQVIATTCRDLRDEHLAIGYSGGLDSNLLASLIDAPRYTVGFPETSDRIRATEATDRPLHLVDLSHEALRSAIPPVSRAIGRTNAMDMAIALSLYLLAEEVASDGYDYIVLGQGADELFGGYEKIARPDHRVHADTVEGARREVLAGLPTGLERDVLALRAGGVEPVMPYLADRVVQTALKLDREHLVREGVRKPILRDVASTYLSRTAAGREKTAIQYGNGVARELDRLARQNGFKRRMGNHVGKYVQSLLD